MYDVTERARECECEDEMSECLLVIINFYYLAPVP